jgi:hypothetical protein
MLTTLRARDAKSRAFGVPICINCCNTFWPPYNSTSSQFDHDPSHRMHNVCAIVSCMLGVVCGDLSTWINVEMSCEYVYVYVCVCVCMPSVLLSRAYWRRSAAIWAPGWISRSAANVYVCIGVRMHMHACVYMCCFFERWTYAQWHHYPKFYVPVCVYIYIYIHTYIYTYMYIYTWRQIYMSVLNAVIAPCNLTKHIASSQTHMYIYIYNITTHTSLCVCKHRISSL